MAKSLVAQQVRVLVERDNLKGKYEDLVKLLAGPNAKDLEPEDRYLLGLQKQAMGSYLYILNRRIEKF